MNIYHYSFVSLIAILVILAIVHKAWWMAMPDQDKDRHAKNVKSKVANGSLVAVKMGDNIVYVKGNSKAAKSFEHVFVGKFSDRIKKRKKK